ncbi:hypothetical protein D3C75_1026780 [compost metagenome]
MIKGGKIERLETRDLMLMLDPVKLLKCRAMGIHRLHQACVPRKIQNGSQAFVLVAPDGNAKQIAQVRGEHLSREHVESRNLVKRGEVALPFLQTRL